MTAKQHIPTTVISAYVNVLPVFFFTCRFVCLDLETFLCDGLKGENLSKRAKERREAIIKRIKEVKSRYVSMSTTVGLHYMEQCERNVT